MANVTTQTAPNVELPLDTPGSIANICESILILAGFIVLGWVCKAIFTWIVRDCLKVQRWPDLATLENILDLHDHLQHNTLATLPTEIKKGVQTQTPYTQSGVPLYRFDTSNPTPIGYSIEVETPPRLVRFDGPVNVNNTIIRDPPSSSKSSSQDQFYTKRDTSSTSAWRKMFCCRNSKSASDIEEADNGADETIDLSSGYPFFKGVHWEKRVIEKRPFSVYFTGNFLTLVGSLMALFCVVVGLVAALRNAKLDFIAATSSTAIFAMVGLFKVADYLGPIVAYFGLLISDRYERGEIVEVASSLGGFHDLPGSSIVGCIMNIDPWTVTLRVNKPYRTFGSINGHHSSFDGQQTLDMHGNLVNTSKFVSSFHGPQTTATPTTKKTESHNESVYYLEHDTIKIKMDFNIKTDDFAKAFIGKHISWMPVANLQQMARQ
jgi:hypothetical protein